MLDHGGISYIATTVGSGVVCDAMAFHAMQRHSTRCNGIPRDATALCAMQRHVATAFYTMQRRCTRHMPRATVPRHRRHTSGHATACVAPLGLCEYSGGSIQPPQRARAGRAFHSGRVGKLSAGQPCVGMGGSAFHSARVGNCSYKRARTATALQHSWLLELLTSLKELTDPKWYVAARSRPSPP
jgi:hypothetical protein